MVQVGGSWLHVELAWHVELVAPTSEWPSAHVNVATEPYVVSA